MHTVSDGQLFPFWRGCGMYLYKCYKFKNGYKWPSEASIFKCAWCPKVLSLWVKALRDTDFFFQKFRVFLALWIIFLCNAFKRRYECVSFFRIESRAFEKFSGKKWAITNTVQCWLLDFMLVNYVGHHQFVLSDTFCCYVLWLRRHQVLLNVFLRWHH